MACSILASKPKIKVHFILKKKTKTLKQESSELQQLAFVVVREWKVGRGGSDVASLLKLRIGEYSDEMFLLF